MITSEPLPSAVPAAVLEGPRSLVVQDIPIWPLEAYGDPDLVLIKVAACGVCGSDFRYFAGENPWAQHTLGKFMPNPPNIVLGHEFAGTVVAAVSEQNRGLLGKRVAPVCSKVCGACAECRSGRSRLCPNTVHLGHGQGWGERDFFPGAYCRYVPAWGSSCYEISDNLSFPEAAMMDILAVCVHVAEVGLVQAGRPVLCIGAGPAGNGIAQAALAMGASFAVLIDRSATALNIARSQGIGTAIDVSDHSTEETLASLEKLASNGFGTVFDSVGSAATIDLGLSVLGKAGTLVNLAVHDEPMPLNLMRLSGERKMVTSCNFEIGDYAKALAWLEAGRFRVQEWLTPVTLQELPVRFEEIVSNPSEKSVFKMVVDPWK
jgi:threonine dehydrogenase-like Zn-dependent dehydrogenase